MLLLKKHLVALVRAGKKHQTIRVWSRPIVRAGQISYTPGLGKMLILGIDELTDFSVLTEADALADGFSDRAALMTELHKIYGSKLPAGKRCYRVHFRWPHDAPVAPLPPALTVPNRVPAAKNGTKRSRTTMTPGQRQKLKAFLLKKPVA